MPPRQVTEAGCINMAAVDKLQGTAQVDKGIVLLMVVGMVAHMAVAGKVAAHMAVVGTVARMAAAGTVVHMAVVGDL